MKFNKKNIEFAGGSTLWSKLFFTWLSPWMSKFLGPGVNADDLPRLPENDDIPLWTSYLEKAVNQEERISKLKGKSLRIYKPLVKVFWFQCLMVLLLKVFFDLLQTLATLSLRSFVASLEPDSASIGSNVKNNDHKSNYYMGSMFIVLTLLKILIETQYSYWCGRVSLRIQASLISMTFRRVVHWKASAISFEESAIGKSARKSIILRHAESRGIQDSEAVISSNVFNLIVVDTLAVEGFLINAIECFIFPFRLIIAYFVLRDSLGSSTTMVGIFTLIVFLVISFTCQIIASTYKAPFMSARDKRIDRCHEVLSEVRTLQMMGYQNIATDRVMKCRKVEMKANQIRNTLSLIGNWIGYQMSGIAQLVLFLLAVYKGINYSREHNIPLVIPASVGVTTLKVLFSLLGPCRNLSMYSFATIEALISFNRFQSFLRSRPLDLRHCDSHSITSNNFYDLSPNTKTPSPLEHACMHNSGANSLDDTRNITTSRLITDDRENSSSPDSTRLLSLRYQTLSSISDKETHEEVTVGNFDGHTNLNLYSRYTTSNRGNNLANLKDVTSKDVVIMRNSSYTWNKDTRKRNNNKYNSDANNEHTHLLDRNCELNTPSGSNNSDVRFKLKKINLSLSLGETIIVVGSPGSGKTSLMNAVLDEIVQESGVTYVQPRETKSPIAYASQIPWIPNGSVKNIILFGRVLNQLKYDVILDCCQLHQDFKSWQDGDLRIVDEGGCSLSGGQRARICLARALYSLPDYLFYSDQESSLSSEPRTDSEMSNHCINSTINSLAATHESILYLLDDIFVSLDPGVSKTIFRKLFGQNGLLRKVATILSIDHTNLSFLMNTSKLFKDFNPKILVLDDGSPQFFGGYQSYLSDWRCVNLDINLKDNGPNFEELSNDEDFAYNHNKYDATTNTIYLPMNPSTKSETLRKVMEKEGRVTGMVSKRTYFWYFSKLKWSWTIALLILCYLKTMFDKGTDYYMGSYTSRAPLSDVDESIYEGKKFALIYTLLAVVQLAVSSMVFIGEAICGIRAAIEIHDNLLVDVLNAPLNFFDSNPVGRVLSRFSTDLLMVDNIPVMKIATVLVGAMNVLFQCIVVVSAEPSVVFLFPMIGLGIYYAVARYFSRSSRELQRMCLVLYSPLCGVFSEAMSGGPIIRAFRAQDHYMLQGTEIIDMVQRAKFMQLCSKEWSSLRTQLLTFPLTAMSSNFFTALISDFFSGPLDTIIGDETITSSKTGLKSVPGAGIVGIALYYSESIASNIGMTITSYVNMEKEMISVERLHQYYEILNKEKIYNLPFSSPCKVEDIVKPNKSGEVVRSGIEIKDLEVRYRRPNSNPADHPDEIYFPPAINRMNACTGPNEHIGVVGRTGSGKSTFLQAILGLVPITSGRVFLDNIPIDQMGSEDRNKLIGILPQVPLILKGWTVSNFLDPYQKFSKDDIWNALNLCGLSSLIRSLPGGKMLDAVIVPDNSSGTTYNSSNTENLRKTKQRSKASEYVNSAHNYEVSDDERYLSDSQLRYLSLARLVLNAKDYRLILVDEPPPDVFQEDTTDYVPIHQLLRQYFPHCTVFVVAHHAASLQNCKKVWVLGKGRILLETNLSLNFSQDRMLQLFQTAEAEFEVLEANKKY
ncbi:ABC transporter family [Cryptosporidium sp. chipmunk genotype I]|uniref:ABC transporter family n=1 Tax=Cryptosporidium sp. chipmunk genotype I TaxID=1280935 RepID=UPI00351A6455|nr:ABC transporter family [Cryptosporidium sp. chipmunk genotype I]